MEDSFLLPAYLPFLDLSPEFVKNLEELVLIAGSILIKTHNSLLQNTNESSDECPVLDFFTVAWVLAHNIIK